MSFGIIMEIFKLYLSSLKKSFTIRGRASRSEFVAFHLIGLIPIAICLLIASPAIHAIMRQGEQLLTNISGNIFPALLQSIKPEAAQGIAAILASSPAIIIFQQKLGAITATFCQHLPSLFFLLLSILIYIVPSFSVSIRRLHDRNLSSYFYLTQFIPPIGTAIFLILMFLNGSDGPNPHGQDPLQKEYF
ncbi:MAG: DUF805 domain-containing protein [Puniceicoccales bacterium]|jgi:uncharacterized membrane protein YhaH (DUF805 family)|nr:DUF805 domain-containing protein [Puniceicoccales bacterium]